MYGLGTWQMGGRYTRDQRNDDARDIRAIRAAIASGITHIDTAEIYAGGHTEELVGQAISGYDRSKLFLVSKVSGDHLSFPDVLHACTASLKRLRTPYLDLYLIHWSNPDIPLKETMRALDILKEKGYIKHIGVSNFLPTTLRKAQSYTKNTIVCNQVHYNLLYREPERKNLLAYCQNHDLFLVAWRPVEKSLLASSRVPLLLDMCKKYRKTPAQIAINWLISQKNIVTIAKTSTLAHLRENLGAIGWVMEKQDIERLRMGFPRQKRISDTVPLR